MDCGARILILSKIQRKSFGYKPTFIVNTSMLVLTSLFFTTYKHQFISLQKRYHTTASLLSSSLWNLNQRNFHRQIDLPYHKPYQNTL